jgi:hypothetical protein
VARHDVQGLEGGGKLEINHSHAADKNTTNGRLYRPGYNMQNLVLTAAQNRLSYDSERGDEKRVWHLLRRLQSRW